MGTTLTVQSFGSVTQAFINPLFRGTAFGSKANMGFRIVTDSHDVFTIYNEPFTIVEDGDEIFLTHPQWSLLGSGKTIHEAYGDLIATARDLAKSLRNENDTSLSAQSRLLKNFVLRIA